MSTIAATNLKNPSSGSNNIVLGTDGSTTIPTLSATTITGTSVRGGITSGTAVASTSGVAIDFTGIPSWVKRVTVMFQGVSTSGTSQLLIRLGTGSGPTYVTTGYIGYTFNTSSNAVAGTSVTSGVPISNSPASAGNYSGMATIATLGSNAWVATSYLGGDNTQGTGGGGSISLGAVLTAVRITTVNGSDTFDAGSINILWEG